MHASYVTQIFGKTEEETKFAVQKIKERGCIVDTSKLYEEEYFAETIKLVQEKLKELEEKDNLEDIKFVIAMTIRDRMMSIVEVTTKHGVVLTPAGIQLFSLLLPDYSREVEDYNSQIEKEEDIVYQ